jgi:type I restriction enzyme S subunit
MRQRYPQYINSSKECLEEIPAHWQTSTLGRLGKFLKGNGGTKEDEVEDGIPCVRYGDIYTQHQYLIRETRSGISKDSLAKYTPMHYGDILFAGSGETIEEIGKSAANLIKEPAYCGGDVIVLRPTIQSDATFFGYAADCLTSTYQKARMGRGVTVMHIYSSELKNLVIPLPPLDEQSTIAAFLDRETARIDQLIVKHELLIERLAEYRNAVITRAVTKGLPPNAARDAGLDPAPRMKSSDSDWIGNVPEHWDIKKLKQSATRTKVKAEAEDLGDITYIGLENVRPWVASLEKTKDPIEPEGTANVFQSGDVLFGKLRPYLAKGLLSDKPGVCSTEFLVITPTDYEGQYLLYLILTKGFIQAVDSSTFGSKMPRANWDFIGNQNLPVPPACEQRAIAEYLDQITTRIDALSERAGTAIERLDEYRAALINAAVTGKIDVREPSAAEEPRE